MNTVVHRLRLLTEKKIVSGQSICCDDVKGKKENVVTRASKKYDFDWSCYILSFDNTGNCYHNYLMENRCNIC